MRNAVYTLAALMLGLAAPMKAQLIDFESVKPDSYSSFTLSAGAVQVTFSRAGGEPVHATEMALAPYSPGVFGGIAIDDALSLSATGIWATFSTPVHAVSLDFSDYSGPRLSPGGEDDTAYLSAYGLSGELLTTTSVYLPKDAGIFSQEYGRVYVSGAQIGSIRFSSTNFGAQPSDSVYWDNLRINDAALSSGIFSMTQPPVSLVPVPEPATYAAAGAALLLLAIYRRKSTRSSVG